MRREDFVVTLASDAGRKYWVAACLICGGTFEHMEYERQVINRWQDHVHLETPNLPVLLSANGHTDDILRAIGVPESLL